MKKNNPGFTRRQALGIIAGAPTVVLAASAASAAPAERGGESRCSLSTRLTSEYGVRHPIVSAGMAFVGLTDLAAAVSNAGGIGVYGAAPEPPQAVDARLAELSGRVRGVYGVDFILAGGPMGDFTTDDHIDIAIGRRVPIVVFHFDIPPKKWVDALRAAGTRVWIQVPSPALADQALEIGADAVIAQGSQAGGHNKNSTVPTLTLVKLIRARSRGALVLAAGGIADGETLVRALEAGADGAWMGTRFVCSTESYAHEGYKAILTKAKGKSATTFTMVYGPEFPNAQQRVIANRAVLSPPTTEPPTIGSTVLFPGALNIPYEMPKYSAIVPTRDTQGDLDEMDMPAGSESILRVAEVRPAAEIIAEVIAEAEAILRGPQHG